MTEANRKLVLAFIDAWNAHDIDACCACVAAECNGGGPEGLRKELTGFYAAIPDLAITLEDSLAEGPRVATRITLRGTHRGPLGGVPATGRAVTMKANHIFHCADGRIIQRHGQMDRLELMMQLGMKVVPADAANA